MKMTLKENIFAFVSKDFLEILQENIKVELLIVNVNMKLNVTGIPVF